MKRILFFVCVLSIAFMYSVAFCTYTTESPETESPSSGNSLFTKFEDDLLSVDIKDVPLGDVLQKLSEETGILFSFPPAIGEESVMVRFSNFTIPEALNKILSSHDRIFIYEEAQSDSDDSLPNRLKEVRIFTPLPKGTPRVATSGGDSSEYSTVTSSKSTEPIQTAKANNVRRMAGKRPPEKKQTVDSLADDLKDSDYAVRLEAIRNLRNVGNADAIGHLTSALEDKNPQVSEAAINALQELQDEKADTTELEENQPLEGGPAPVIVSSVSGDVNNITTVDLDLSVDAPLITAAMMVEYDPKVLKINSATFKDAWDQGMSSSNPAQGQPGKYILTAGNLSDAKPDPNGTIGYARVDAECLTGNCSGATIKFSPIPGFDSFVSGTSGQSKVYDPDIDPVIVTLQ